MLTRLKVKLSTPPPSPLEMFSCSRSSFLSTSVVTSDENFELLQLMALVELGGFRISGWVYRHYRWRGGGGVGEGFPQALRPAAFQAAPRQPALLTAGFSPKLFLFQAALHHPLLLLADSGSPATSTLGVL